ncbi:MAG: pirin family protein [Chitinophagaceae bacterium]|nr:pirin family protein [Chitinophagaceae bacterium]
MTIKRNIADAWFPESHPGFLGAGHLARPVLKGPFNHTDPFIVLMDDRIDKKDHIPVGGPHPHAGFETVTLILEGQLGEQEGSVMKQGDFQMMTAGSGIEHAEVIDKPGVIRILQLWLDLPKEKRSIAPRVQELPSDNVPVMEKDNVQIRVYSGSLAGISSPVLNHVPVIIADITMQPGSSTSIQIPANYNGFLYMLEGALLVGDKEGYLEQDQTGWLDLYKEDEPSELALKAGTTGARFVLYAGKPTGDSIISHGPFITDTEEDIKRLYREYRQGKLQHVTQLPEEQKFLW